MGAQQKHCNEHKGIVHFFLSIAEDYLEVS